MASNKEQICLEIGELAPKNENSDKPLTRRNFIAILALVSIGFIGGILVAGKNGTQGPVNVQVHLSSPQNGIHSSSASEPLVLERKLAFAEKSQITSLKVDASPLLDAASTSAVSEATYVQFHYFFYFLLSHHTFSRNQ